jgi:hypothetical protein
MMRFKFLACMSPPPLGLLPVLLPPRLLTVMMNFLFCVSYAVMLCFRDMVALRLLSRAPMFFALAPPLLLLALNLPRRLVATADDLSVMFRPPHGDFLDFTIHFQPCKWWWMAEEVNQQQPSQKMAQRLSTQTCQSQPFSVTSVTSMHICSFKQNVVNFSNVEEKVREAQEKDAILPACACMSQHETGAHHVVTQMLPALLNRYLK